MKYVLLVIVLALASACAGVMPSPSPAHETRKLLAFENANLVDVQRGTIVRGVTVVVEGERILKVSTRPVPLPHGSRRIDATGRYLMPGLWDMYSFALDGVQKDEPVLELLVAHGVTGIRDMGSAMDLEKQRAVRDAVLEGKRPGPRILYAGRRLSAPTARATPALEVISNDREAAAAIQSLKEAGAEVVVGASSLTPGLTPIVAAEARKHGMSSSAWVVSGWIDAAGTGIRALDHPADLHRSTSLHRQEYFDFYARHQMKPLPPREQADPMFARMVETPDRPYYLDTLRAIARNRMYVVTNFASFYFARRDWEFKDAARARFHTKGAAAEMAAGAKEGTYEGRAGPKVLEALGHAPDGREALARNRRRQTRPRDARCASARRAGTLRAQRHAARRSPARCDYQRCDIPRPCG